ncbi:TPA: hypothetical protein JI136_07775 [Acinetobacter baumannii]|nr:hypothetical protein [Acinetobacter baumannii]HAV5726338.1 hypothetical protein [Acinetobacter baumannii]HAV5728904.1 hypothetical protein [Acinetobacter baumannii]
MKEKVFSDWYYQTRDITARAGFDAAWQHQQAKVKELQTHAQEIHKREIKLFEKTLILTHERDELQKRVDALIQKYKDEDRELKLIDEWEQSQIYGLVAIELEQALKGGGQ